MKINYKTRKLRGFTLGMSMIIMSILLTVALGMSVLLLRDLKNTDITQRSAIAYNLADGMMSCISSYENHIRYINGTGYDEVGLFATSSTFNYDTAYRENYTGDSYNYLKESIKCYDVSIFDNANMTITPVDNTSDGPSAYIGGARTSIKLQTQDMVDTLYGACVEANIYGKGNVEKLIVTHAKVPCNSSPAVERVIVKSIQ